MSLKLLLVCLLLVSALAELGELNYLQQSRSSTLEELVNEFGEGQGEIYRKVWIKYIDQQLGVWR